MVGALREALVAAAVDALGMPQKAGDAAVDAIVTVCSVCVEWGCGGACHSVKCVCMCGRESDWRSEKVKVVGICGMGLRVEEISLIAELRLKMFDDSQVHCPAFPCPVVTFFAFIFSIHFGYYIGHKFSYYHF